MGIINGILKFVSTPLNWLGSAFSRGNVNNNTTNSVKVEVSNNSSQGIDPSQLAVDIGMQVQNALTR